MKRNRAVLLATTLLAGAGLGIAFADGKHGHHETMTVQGEILDLACYVARQAKGADHAGCAKRCVKGGQPMGLLAEDGTVYLLYANHKDGSAFEAAKEHAGAKVELTGAMATEAGIKGLEVHGVKPL